MFSTILFSYMFISTAVSLSVCVIAGRAARLEEQMELAPLSIHIR
jgi:hypothetical protein